MSDQELLEYAAKALQLHIKGHLKRHGRKSSRRISWRNHPA